MRILQVIPVFSSQFGGPVEVVRSISKELAKKHDVAIYTTSAFDKKNDFRSFPLEVESDGYRIVYFPRILRSSGFNISPAMAMAIKETINEYDLVHLHSWRHFQDIIVHHYAERNGVPYVLQAHGSLPRIVTKHGLKLVYDLLFGYRLLRNASKVIALNQMEAEQYRCMSVPQEKIEIVPNGINLTRYANLPPLGSFRRKFNIENNQKLILYLGRIHEIKGIDILIKAFTKVIKKVDDVKLVIVGPDDGYLENIQVLINNLCSTLGIVISQILPLNGIKSLNSLCSKLNSLVDAFSENTKFSFFYLC